MNAYIEGASRKLNGIIYRKKRYRGITCYTVLSIGMAHMNAHYNKTDTYNIVHISTYIEYNKERNTASIAQSGNVDPMTS